MVRPAARQNDVFLGAPPAIIPAGARPEKTSSENENTTNGAARRETKWRLFGSQHQLRHVAGTTHLGLKRTHEPDPLLRATQQQGARLEEGKSLCKRGLF